MKKNSQKYLFPIILLLLVLIFTVGAFFAGKFLMDAKPFRDLSESDIASITLQIAPPDVEIELTEDEVSQVVPLLREVTLLHKDPEFYAGQSALFTLTYADGTVTHANFCGSHLNLDGSGYQTNTSAADAVDAFVDSLKSRIHLEEMTCRIVDGADTGNLLLATQGTSSDIYRLSVEDMGIAYDELQNGMLVQVSYYDGILESYPAQFADPRGITVPDRKIDDLCSLYLDVLEKLWETDSGLNSDISMVSVDLSQTSLSPAEQAAVAWAFGERHGLEVLQLGFAALSEQGYIKKDELYWEDGCLFTISETKKTSDSVTFDAEKWRSGLGAYFFMDCDSSKDNRGHWAEFEIGAEAIS